MTPGDRFFDRIPMPRTGACPTCDGLGYTLETIDDERYPAKVPCYRCQQWCQTCRGYKRKPHSHPLTSESTRPLAPGA